MNDAWIELARAVPIEHELARRGIKLRGNKVERDGPCPKCGGDDRFSINTKKQVFNCRGCGTGGDVIALVRHLDGVSFVEACRTLVGEPAAKANGKDHAAEAAREVCTATFTYHDENGAALFMVGRMQYRKPDGSFLLKDDGKPKKKFSQKRPDPDRPGQWIKNVEGVRIVPYKLPELLEAIGSEHFIVIVEGEAKADLLWSWNVPATSCAGGAKKWRAEHSEFLRDADVIILPDNDEPGREHADVVGASLQGIAKSVRVLELPGLAPKGDVIDWARQGGTVEQLHDLIAREARPWTPHNNASEQEAGKADSEQQDAGKRDNTTLASAHASTFEMEAFDWLWENRFAIGKLSLIVGLPDEGKGQLLCYLAAQVTTAELWPCNEGRAPLGNVLMFTDEDDPHDTVVPRLAAAGADLDRVVIARMVHDNNKDRIFSLLTDIELLHKKIIEIGNVNLVLIDPISAYLGIGKIDSFRTTDVRAVLAPLVNLAAKLHVAIIAVMHFNKKIDVTNALLRISDSLAFGAVARGVYAIIDDAKHERKLIVRAKNNIAAKTAKTLAFRFTAREVGTDKKTGKAILAPYIVFDPQYVDVSATEAMQAAADNKSPGARDAAKKLLREMLASGPAARTEIEEAADNNGITTRTLFRAKDDLEIIAKKDRSHAGGQWTWELPAGPKHWTHGKDD